MNWLRQTLSGVGGGMSSKRVFNFILIILFCIYFFVNLFTGRILKPSLEDYLFYLIVIMFVGVTAEGWKPKDKNVDKVESTTTTTETEIKTKTE